MKKNVILIMLLGIIYSCSSRLISPSIHSTTEQLQLGEIGEDKNFVLEKDYTHTAIPLYDSPVKINVQLQGFEKSSYKAFQKTNLKQNKKVTITYVDSLKTKPKYLKLNIADRVAVLNAINSKKNKDLKAYLKNKFNSHLIHQVSILFPLNIQNKILNADEVFIKNYGIKSYAIYLYNNGEILDTVKFSDGVVFSYSASNFCWKKLKNSQWDIVDILEQDQRCSRGTYRFPNTEPKDVDDYLKF